MGKGKKKQIRKVGEGGKKKQEKENGDEEKKRLRKRRSDKRARRRGKVTGIAKYGSAREREEKCKTAARGELRISKGTEKKKKNPSLGTATGSIDLS